MLKILSTLVMYMGIGLKDMALSVVGLFRDTAVQQFADLKIHWKYELGQRSGYLFWKCFEPDDSQNSTVYKLLPGNRYMRVLQVMCSTTRPSKQFVGNLMPTCVDSPEVPYIAISYTWGDPSVVAEIDCKNGKVIPITKSVYTILDTLLEKDEIIRLWIDAVCINQNDIEEKNQQVQMMSDIYKNAAYVVVSLGESDSETDAAMDYIYHLSKAINQEIQKIRRIGNPNQKIEKIRQIDNPKNGFHKWILIENLLRKSWFERIWVIQEVAMGPEPLIVCGKRAVNWGMFCHALFGFLKHSLSLRRDLPKPDSPNGDRYSPSFPVGLLNLQIMNTARESLQKRGGEPFQTILLYMNHFKATNARDKVFALLGLRRDTNDKTLQADYNSTPENVYQTVSRHLLLCDPYIHILNMAGVGFPRLSTSLPSWVPDFKNSETISFGHYFPQSVEFHAAGESESVVAPGPSENTIVISGVRIDTVLRLTDSCEPSCTNWFTQVEALFKDVQRLPESQLNDIVRRQHREGKESWLDVLYCALINYRTPSDYRTDADEFGKHFQVWREYILNQNFDIYNAVWVGLVDAKHRIESSQLDQSTELRAFENICRATARSRRFFTTKMGFLGLTSPGTEEGDIVVIFSGGITPFIVRESKSVAGEFTLLGEAYVHDIMYGEAMGSGHVETFLLV